MGANYYAVMKKPTTANHICYGMGFGHKRQAASYRGRTYNSWNYICGNLFCILGGLKNGNEMASDC